MHWLVIIALVGFALHQGLAIQRLERRLEAVMRALERAVGGPRPSTPPAPRDPAQTPPAEARAREIVAAAAAPPRRTAAYDPPPPFKEPDWSYRPRPAAPPEPEVGPEPDNRPTWPALSTWLAENGLAWIGGGGLALGGLLLVVYAAQQGVFTPPLRIAAAVIAGGLMLAASEWILRRPPVEGGRHLLAAAVAAGAGAVTLYGAVCAAHTLYGFIPFPVAAGLTGAISLGLLGLSLRHGEPLALLAILGAVITPWVTGLSAWSPFALHGWALLIGVTGFVLSATRLWGKAGYLTLAGLLVWSLTDAFGGGALLLLLAAAGPAAGAAWRRANRMEIADETERKVFFSQPAIALALASLFAFRLWFGAAPAGSFAPQAVLLAGALVALGAALARANLAPPAIFAAPVASAVLASLATLTVYGQAPDFAIVVAWVYGLMAVIPAATFAAALTASPAARTTLLATGGVGVAVLASLAWPLLAAQAVQLPWLPAAVIAGALFVGAAFIARRVEDVRTDRGLVFWLAAAAELAFLALHAAILPEAQPVAFAAAALLMAFAAARLGWAGLAQASVVGGLLALATVFHPGFMGQALDGDLTLPLALGATTGAAALLYLGARLMAGSDRGARHEAEAQATAALMMLMAGLFIGLHVILSGVERRPVSADLFEASLRTLLLLAAGLLLVVRQRPDDGPIARWRTLAVVGAGLVHGLAVQGLIQNPWWGLGAAPAGLPVINTLVVGYLAPAVVLAACAIRRRPTDDWARAWAGAAAVFAFLWALLTIRHLFHSAAMGDAGVAAAEAAAYAVLMLLTARLLRIQRPGAGASGRLRAAAVPVGWIALAVSLLTFGFYASPWWGPLSAPLASTAEALLLFALYGLGAVGLAAVRRTGGALGQAATAGVVAVLFALMTLLIRWAFHGGDMGGEAPHGGLETWTYSALWAVFGLGALALGTVRRDPVLRWAGLAVLLVTAGKVLLFDLSRLQGVTRAASFLAVGALFLAGALAARRLNLRSRED